MAENIADLYGLQPVDRDAVTEAWDGNAVISGLTSAEKGTPDMSVDVAAGAARAGGSYYLFSSTTNVTLTAAHATLPRKDLIVLNSSGTLTKRDGTAEAAAPTGQVRRFTYRPAAPELTAGDTVLAEVYVAPTVTQIFNADISDRRVVLRRYYPATLTPLGAVIDTGDAGPSKTQIDGTNHAYYVLDYADAATETAYWQFSMPRDYVARDMVFIIRWFSAAATTNEARWAVATLGRTNDEAWDVALSADIAVDDTTSGTAGRISEATITMTSAQHGIVDGDTVVVAIRRLGGHANDDLVGDARFVSCLVEI